MENDLMKEYKKCKEDPVYFYNNYIRKEGEREVTKEELDSMKKSVFLKPRRGAAIYFPKKTNYGDN